MLICWCRYKRENEVVSDSYKRYDASVPQYLRNRPRKIVKHCMKRFISAREIKENSITRKEDVYLVKSTSSNEVYKVSLCNEFNFPSCSCKDFDNHFLPCKHMFAIFQKYADVGWESLPSWYRDSAHMVLDQEVLSNTIDTSKSENKTVGEDFAPDQFLQQEVSKEDDKSCNIMNTSGECTYAEKKKVMDTINNLICEIRNTSFDVRSLEALKEAESNLENILKSPMNSCSYQNGIRLSTCTSKPRKVLKIKRKSTSSFCDELPRKYTKPNPYSSRVGEKANEMKRVHAVTTLCPVINTSFVGNARNLDATEGSKCTSKDCTSIVPHLASVQYSSPSENLLKNGPHSLSFIHLKSIEPVLTAGELNVLKSHDNRFICGWIYDEVINSYLRQLCKQNHYCIYASSTITQIIENGKSIKNLWKDEQLQNKKLIFLPWNPFGTHWILLVVDITNRKMLYLDPLQLSTAPTMLMLRAKKLVDKLLLEKFSFCVESVEELKRFLQPDQDSCRVVVCIYA